MEWPRNQRLNDQVVAYVVDGAGLARTGPHSGTVAFRTRVAGQAGDLASRSRGASSSRTSVELRCLRRLRRDRRASWFARSSRSTQRDAKNSRMMEMGIVPTDGARRTTTPAMAVLRCRTVPRASAQKTDMRRLNVYVEIRPNDAVPHANQPLAPFSSQNLGTLLKSTNGSARSSCLRLRRLPFHHPDVRFHLAQSW